MLSVIGAAACDAPDAISPLPFAEPQATENVEESCKGFTVKECEAIRRAIQRGIQLQNVDPGCYATAKNLSSDWNWGRITFREYVMHEGDNIMGWGTVGSHAIMYLTEHLMLNADEYELFVTMFHEDGHHQGFGDDWSEAHGRYCADLWVRKFGYMGGTFSEKAGAGGGGGTLE